MQLESEIVGLIVLVEQIGANQDVQCPDNGRNRQDGSIMQALRNGFIVILFKNFLRRHVRINRAYLEPNDHRPIPSRAGRILEASQQTATLGVDQLGLLEMSHCLDSRAP